MFYTRYEHDLCFVENSRICTPNIEAAWLRLRLTNSKDIMICCVYLPPDGDVDLGLDELHLLMEDVNLYPRHDVIFLGDFNID